MGKDSNKERNKARSRAQAERARQYQAWKKRTNEDKKASAIRAKYGPSRRSAPVVVKSLDGEVLRVEKAQKFKERRYSKLLDDRAIAAGYKDYAAYLASGYWQDVRARVLTRDDRRCAICRTRGNVQVHHDRYDFIGREQLKYLKTICARCHRRIHRS